MFPDLIIKLLIGEINRGIGFYGEMRQCTITSVPVKNETGVRVESGLMKMLFYSRPGYLILGFINTKESSVQHKPQQIYPKTLQ